MHWRRKWQSTPVFLPGESQGRGSLVAAVYAVAQSRTRLKQLSSSSSSFHVLSWFKNDTFSFGAWKTEGLNKRVEKGMLSIIREVQDALGAQSRGI